MTLANCANLMIYDDHDFRDNWGSDMNDSLRDSAEYFVGKCAQHAYFEYQRQLYVDVDFTQLEAIDRDHHLHVYGQHGFILTETRAAGSFRKEASDITPFLGWRQWEDIRNALSSEGLMKNVCHLSIVTPCPLVYLPHKLNSALEKWIPDAEGHWASNKFRAEQNAMLGLLKQWQDEKVDRTVTIIGGKQHTITLLSIICFLSCCSHRFFRMIISLLGDVHVGGHTTIYQDERPVFQQFTTSAVANHVLPKMAFFVGSTIQNWSTQLLNGWSFSHAGFVRERNFGHLTITGKPEISRPVVERHLFTAAKGEAEKIYDNITYNEIKPPQVTEKVISQAKITQTSADKSNLPDTGKRVDQTQHNKEMEHHLNLPKHLV
jgi:hypothetical protein